MTDTKTRTEFLDIVGTNVPGDVDLSDITAKEWLIVKQHLQSQRFYPFYIYLLCKSAQRESEARELIEADKYISTNMDKHLIIDPREWFGVLTEKCQSIPDVLNDIIFDEIQRQKPKPTQIDMCGRAECEIPLNWHWNLVTRLLAKGYSVFDNNTTDICHPLIVHTDPLRRGVCSWKHYREALYFIFNLPDGVGDLEKRKLFEEELVKQREELAKQHQMLLDQMRNFKVRDDDD